MTNTFVSNQSTEALRILENTNESLFLTGKAGTGKSTLLREFRDTTTKKVVVLAPTGVAALNVEGQTIHSFFRLRPGSKPADITKRRPNAQLRKILEQAETIIIDEISMVRCDLLDLVDVAMRHHLQDDLPFANKQMVFIGDLYQLPPVLRGPDQKELFEAGYESPYFFNAKCLRDFGYHTIELDQVYRQSDSQFINILNNIRNGDLHENDLKILNEQHNPYRLPSNSTITLTTTNARADEINHYKLEELPSVAKVCKARFQGEFKSGYLPTQEQLTFKAGAQVMLLTNDATGRWVNGSIGHIDSFNINLETQIPELHITLTTGKKIRVEPHKWEVQSYGLDPITNELTQQTKGSFTQFPIKLAWAITIHKSQGQTFDEVIIDLGQRTFAHGQTYVALSRCRSLQGITLSRKLTANHMQIDPRVIEFMQGIGRGW